MPMYPWKNPKDIYNCITLTNLQTKGDYKETAEFFNDNFGIKSTFVTYKPVYSSSEFSPTPEEVKSASIVKNKVNGSNFPPIPQCVDKFYCGTTMSIINKLYLTPCSRIRHSFADITNKRFIDSFYQNIDILLKLPLRDETKPIKCRDCERRGICWGCRGNAWYYESNIMGTDTKCWVQ